MSRDHFMCDKQAQMPSIKLYPLLREDNSRRLKIRLAPRFNPTLVYEIYGHKSVKKKTHLL